MAMTDPMRFVPPVRPSHFSIRSTILLAIIAGMVLPALAGLALDAHFSRALHAPIVERNRAAARLLAASLVTVPAWTLSEPGLQAAADRIVAEPSVCGVEVLDLQPAAAPMRVARRRCPAQTPVVVAETPVLHEGQSVARLRLQFDDTEIDQMLAVRTRQLAAVLAAQVLVGMLVLAGVLSVRVLRPINRLREQAGTLASREPTPLQHWPRADELGQLGRYLNDVRARLLDLFGELQSKNDELHRMAMHDQLTGLPDAVRAAMRRHGMKRGELEIELTESALLADTDGALRTIAGLREAGALLSIDDFGTGYSSPSYLKLLKPDKLKIDRSFVRDLPHDADDHALTQAIMAMAQALQITVVAEGVEETAQRDLLLKLGCVLQQGYLFGRPMPASELGARLATTATSA
ncbi:MAG: hypothetical protein C0505_11470 [Leptothrix sp. (in: Bacteria)]|nr:hypothetical protein [Leptothrix sp. (in: b-proteobacteria)]